MKRVNGSLKWMALGMAVWLGLQPLATVAAAAPESAPDTREAGRILVELDARLSGEKGFAYLDSEGKPTDYVKAFESKKPFFLRPTGPGYQKDRLIGLALRQEPEAIVAHVSVYDQSEGFAKKKLKGAAKIEFGPKGGDPRAVIDRIDVEMKSITSQLVASAPGAPSDRRVAASSCIETKIINYTLTAAILGGVALGIEMGYKLFIRKAPTPSGFVAYRLWGALTGLGITALIAGGARLVRHFRCDEIQGY